MTTSPLLTIGAFARAVGLSPSALRHYDECGLLPPVEVDGATGYRYYTPDLADRARLIVAMREAGVPIELMRRVVDGPPAEAGSVLATLVRERTADAARVEAVLRDVLAAVEDAPSAGAHVRLDARALASSLRQVRPAAESDPTSPLSGVLLDVGASDVELAATNRYWMAVRSLEAVDISGQDRIVLGLAEAARLAELLDGLDEVDLEIADGRLGIAGSDAAPVAGRTTPFPAHRLVVGGLEPAVTRVLVPARGLADAVGRTGRSEVDLAITPGGATVGADEAPSYDVGGVARGPAVTVRLGSALLQRAVGACLGAEVVVDVTADDRPVQLCSPYQAGFLALVMPIRPE